MKEKTQRARHAFAGQREGQELAQWLNNEEPLRLGASRDKLRKETRGNGRTRKRIAQLVQDLNKSAELYIREDKPDSALVKRIDDEFSRYKLKVKPVHPLDTGQYKTFAAPQWIFGWYS